MEDYIKEHKLYMYNIGNPNCGTISSTEPHVSKYYSYPTMNTKIKGNGRIMADDCADTSASTIINGVFVYTSDNSNTNDIFEVS